MALKAGLFDGGTTRAKVSTVISHTRVDWLELELYADPDNSGIAYWGPVTITDAGVAAYGELKAGYTKRWYCGGAPFKLDPTTLYVVGSAASQRVYINGITADGRRIPIQGPGTVTDS